MSPADRHLRDAVAPVARQQQELDVEAEAVDLRARKEIMRHGRVEQLEAALCVVIPSHSEQLDELVKHPTDQPPVPADPNHPVLRGKKTRADRGVSARA